MAIPLPSNLPALNHAPRVANFSARSEVKAVAVAARLAIPLGLMALAYLIRSVNLMVLDPFGDEVTWLRWAVDHFNLWQPSTYWTPLEDEGRPPLFFWLLAFMTSVDPNAFVGGRLAAALASAATTGVIYAIGVSLRSRSVGILAGLLWAVLPFGVIFGRLASSDDALLALCIGLVTWASIYAVRSPSYLSGALCGAAIALAVLSKTLGILTVAMPFIAVLTLSTPDSRRTLSRAASGAAVALLIGISPLLMWAPSMLEKADHHADLEVEQRSGAGVKHDTAYRIVLNSSDTASYLAAYLGVPLLVLAGAGIASGLVRRDRTVRFLALCAVTGIAPIVIFTTVLYSRYLLGFSLPLYLLAATGALDLWRWIQRSRALERLGTSGRLATSAVAGSLLVVAFVPQINLTHAWLTEPSTAQLPEEDRWRYFEHRWTLLGLRDHIDYLKEASEAGPIVVVQPRDAPEFRFELPYNALRLYLRGASNISFDDIPAIRNDASDRAYQAITRSRKPTYLILNDMDQDMAAAHALKVDTYERVHRSLPAATVAQRSIRRDDGYVLTLYRADSGEQVDATVPRPAASVATITVAD